MEQKLMTENPRPHTQSTPNRIPNMSDMTLQLTSTSFVVRPVDNLPFPSGFGISNLKSRISELHIRLEFDERDYMRLSCDARTSERLLFEVKFVERRIIFQPEKEGPFDQVLQRQLGLCMNLIDMLAFDIPKLLPSTLLATKEKAKMNVSAFIL